MCLVRRIPHVQNVVLGPRRIDHNAIGTSTDNAVEGGKQSIVVQLRPRQEWILRYMTFVVVRHSPIGDTTQHVRANGRVMGVRGNFALANVLEDWIRERVAWKFIKT